MSETIRYRDALLRRVQITVSELSKRPASDICAADVVYKSIDDDTEFSAQFLFSKTRLTESGMTMERVPVGELEKLAKWFVINGTYRHDYNEVTIYSNKGENLGFRVDANQNFVLYFPPLSELPVLESRLARRAIISELYHAGELTRAEIVERAHMPRKPVDTEINGLLAQHEYLVFLNEGQQFHFLTTKGREYYETSLRKRSGLAFIIAACHAYDREGVIITDKDNPHLGTLELYKDRLRELGYDPKFQEHEEPRKNIYVDIFDYIDASEIVIADITWERPSCYIEIGYALSRQKPIILFVEAEYFATRMKGKLPFDLSLVKYQDYRYAEQEKLKTELEERVKVWRGRLN